MTVTIWHNPRCSKSRATLAVLEEAGVTPEVLKYVEVSPSEAELRAALSKLGMKASELIRTGESIYTELDLAGADEDTLIAVMSAHPILIERPVVFANGKATIGRPPEAVKDIL